MPPVCGGSSGRSLTSGSPGRHPVASEESGRLGRRCKTARGLGRCRCDHRCKRRSAWRPARPARIDLRGISERQAAGQGLLLGPAHQLFDLGRRQIGRRRPVEVGGVRRRSRGLGVIPGQPAWARPTTSRRGRVTRSLRRLSMTLTRFHLANPKKMHCHDGPTSRLHAKGWGGQVGEVGPSSYCFR